MNLAPNGKPSNLTPEQYRLVRTPEFKKWFGDWEKAYETGNYDNVSKVIDEKTKEPLVVYHGGNVKNIFDKNKIGVNDEGWYGYGFYFTEDMSFASEWGKSNPYFILIKKPFEIVKKGIDIINPFYNNSKKETDNKINEGYDGSFAKLSMPNEYVVYYEFSNQIKLADGTNTTFDANNPDIRFDEGGEVLIAPNGKPSNLTPEQYRLVRTPAFKKWFGDWENSPETSSKVVDNNGEPLVVYHGSVKDFSIFSFDKLGSGIKANLGYLGIYFTDDKTLATDFTRIKWTNPNSKFKKDSKVYEVFLKIKNPKYMTIDGFILMDNKNRSEESIKNVRKDLLKKGYDGIIVEKAQLYWQSKMREFDGKQYIILQNNKNIKLADGTNTTFDANNPDIRYADGGLISKYKDYEIVIVEKEYSGSSVQAIITQNGNHIGMITLDDFPNEPYVNYSGIDDEHRGQGLGSYVYQLLDDYSFKKTGKNITHGDINSSISAIRLWRKRLNNPNYLPYGFYDYWEDDAEEVLKELNSGNKYELGGELTLTSEQVENKLGRELHWWKDDIVYLSGIKYKKVYLRPEYKRI